MENLELLSKALTKSEQSDLINKTCQLIIDGEIDPIKAELALKAIENVIKDIRSNNHVKRITREETDKYGKSFKLYGAKIENSQRTTYDYSECGDNILNSLYAEKREIEAQIKIRESIVKYGVDIETGETFNPPKTSTTEFLKITFE